MGSLLVLTLLYLPVFMAYWFAPVLAGWGQVNTGRALFFSLVACLRNWKPLLVFVTSLVVAGVILPGVVIGAITLFFPTLGAILTVIPPLLLIPIMFASFYANTRDVFAELDPGAGRAA